MSEPYEYKNDNRSVPCHFKRDGSIHYTRHKDNEGYGFDLFYQRWVQLPGIHETHVELPNPHRFKLGLWIDEPL